MKRIARTFALAAAMAACSTAKAEIDYPFLFTDGGDPVTHFGYTLENLRGSSTLAFSDTLSGALNFSGTTVSALNGATVSEDLDTGNFVSSPGGFGFSGQFDDEAMTFSLRDIRTFGGILLTAPGALPNGQQNPTSSGGSLQISDLRVRFEDRSVYARVAGANGVVSSQSFKLWNIAHIEGDTTVSLLERPAQLDIRVSGLTFTAEARDLFKQALGLTGPVAIFFSPMSELDAGMLSFTATLDVTGPIPEPSTYALMGLGLIGLGLAVRRARQTA